MSLQVAEIRSKLSKSPATSGTFGDSPTRPALLKWCMKAFPLLLFSHKERRVEWSLQTPSQPLCSNLKSTVVIERPFYAKLGGVVAPKKRHVYDNALVTGSFRSTYQHSSCISMSHGHRYSSTKPYLYWRYGVPTIGQALLGRAKSSSYRALV